MEATCAAAIAASGTIYDEAMASLDTSAGGFIGEDWNDIGEGLSPGAGVESPAPVVSASRPEAGRMRRPSLYGDLFGLPDQQRLNAQTEAEEDVKDGFGILQALASAGSEVVQEAEPPVTAARRPSVVAPLLGETESNALAGCPVADPVSWT